MKRIFCEILLFAVLLNAAVSPWKVQVLGAKVYSEKFLIEQLDLPAEMDAVLRERRDFIIKLSKGNLEAFYQSNGYFSGSVSLLVKEELVDSTIVETYIFEVNEGERYRFRNASIVLEEEAESLIELTELSVPKGAFYDPEYISNDQKIIRDVYQRKGYLHIMLDHFEDIDTTEKKVDVRYLVKPKEQVRMGNFRSIAFRSGLMPGQTKPERGLSDTAWLSSLWEIPRDSIVDGRYFFSFRAKLFSTQLFSQVHLEDSLQENGLSDITLVAYERIPGETNYGIFFDQLSGFGVSYSSMHRNFFGAFHGMGLGIILAEKKQELSFNYTNPLLFGTRVSWIPTAIRLDEKIFFNHEKLPELSDPNTLIERWEVASRANLSFGLSSSNHIRARNTLDIRFLRLPVRDLFKIKSEIGLTFDFTDNNYDPVRGIRLTPSFGAGGILENESFNKFKNTKSISDLLDIGLNYGFLYTDATASVYIPIKRRYLLSAVAFSYGNIFNNADIDDAQTFYQGGGRTLRGYRFRTVYPGKTVNDSIIVTGTSPQYFRINEELRFIPTWRALKSFQFVQFTDWAHVNDSDKSYDSKTRASLGLGLRYKWQFLTFRLDYAMKTEFSDFKPDKFNFSHIVFDLSQAI
ncbi:MAG: BamA/TamA family outer membrane protein [Fibromonadaceae bacterium]|nr:BamA/TamA family outer membrane protein [Fibromonadaceae bacterium]